MFLSHLHTWNFPLLHLNPPFQANCVVFHYLYCHIPTEYSLGGDWVLVFPKLGASETKAVLPAQQGAGWIHTQVSGHTVLPRRIAVWLSKAKVLRLGSLNTVTLHGLDIMAFLIQEPAQQGLNKWSNFLLWQIMLGQGEMVLN